MNNKIINNKNMIQPYLPFDYIKWYKYYYDNGFDNEKIIKDLNDNLDERFCRHVYKSGKKNRLCLMYTKTKKTDGIKPLC